MPFQFNCPNGHLLEALESQAGDRCNCPHCGILMIIPQPPETGPTSDEADEEIIESPQPSPAVELASDQEKLLHIPCPNGHVLDTPRDMLDQLVMCPHCEAEFRLRESDSQEYQRRKQLQEESRERRSGQLWMNWSVVIAVIVVLGLALLIFLSSAVN